MEKFERKPKKGEHKMQDNSEESRRNEKKIERKPRKVDYNDTRPPSSPDYRDSTYSCAMY